MYRKRLNWYNWNEFLKYLLTHDINDLHELCGHYHNCGRFVCPHSPLISKTGNCYDSSIHIRYIEQSKYSGASNWCLNIDIRRSLYTHNDWMRGIVQVWREFVINRKRDRAARVIQEYAIRWLYNPHREGPSFRRLKRCIGDGSIGLI